MKLQQIIVESTDFTDPRGNVIVSRSNNLDNDIANKMALWGTVRTGLLPRHQSAIYYTKLNKRFGLLGRSYSGGYDSHGDRPLYSQLVLLADANLRAYKNNPVLFARLLNSSGSWMLTPAPAKLLPELSLPPSTIDTFEYEQECEENDRIFKALELHDRLGLTDVKEPLAFLGSFLNSIEFEKRARISFSSGRRYFENAPFQISCYPGGDIHLEHELNEKKVYPIRLRTGQHCG